MKLAVSNIAWTNEEEPEVAKLLKKLKVTHVEVAPTKLWHDPTSVDHQEFKDYAAMWKSYGIKIVALQSMLFNRPDLKLFESEANTAQTLEYLQKYIGVAKALGAKVMVFGSPKNRQRGELSFKDATKKAKHFFGEISKVAKQYDVAFCIEPNAADYACDFITNAKEGLEFIRDHANDPVKLHLDIACMTLAKDKLTASIEAAKDHLQHFHISSPFLDAVKDRPDVKHREAAAALKNIGYKGFVSIEMRPGEPGTNLERVREAVTFAQKVYGV